MKPFLLHHCLTKYFSAGLNDLLSQIREVIRPDKIYLLGAALYRRRNESIFLPAATETRQPGDYCFLVLVGTLHGSSTYEWQDKIESHCRSAAPLTSLVMETSRFSEWLNSGHRFARTVVESAVPLYDSGNAGFSATPDSSEAAANKQPDGHFREGLNRAREFLAGAELFRIREQNSMAAFMLHQVAEQSLRTLLKTGTGLHYNTHNLERLIRYAGLASCHVQDVFPCKTENEKRLFRLLQKAYTDCRYKNDYRINLADLLSLTGKVERLLEILAEEGGRWLHFAGTGPKDIPAGGGSAGQETILPGIRM